MTKHHITIAAVIILVAGASLSGCAQLAAGAANIAATVTGSTPHQVKTLAEAEQTATLVTKAVDLAVNTGKLPRATLVELNSLSDGLHAALGALQQANANGQALNFAAFNAALAAYNAYTTSQGIAH